MNASRNLPPSDRIEPLYAGKLGVCCATGPSLTKEVCDYLSLRYDQIALFGCNDAFRQFTRLHVHYACDPTWWDKHHADITQSGISIESGMWTQDQNSAKKYQLKYIQSSSNKGLSIVPSVINQGSNSGFQLINLAYNFGIRRFLLCGYNMAVVEGKRHFFGDHPNGLHRGGDYTGFAKQFESIDCRALNITITNCTERSKLTAFPMGKLEDHLP